MFILSNVYSMHKPNVYSFTIFRVFGQKMDIFGYRHVEYSIYRPVAYLGLFKNKFAMQIFHRKFQAKMCNANAE